MNPFFKETTQNHEPDFLLQATDRRILGVLTGLQIPIPQTCSD